MQAPLNVASCQVHAFISHDLLGVLVFDLETTLGPMSKFLVKMALHVGGWHTGRGGFI